MIGFTGPYSYLQVLRKQQEEEERRRKIEAMLKASSGDKAGAVHTGSDNYGFMMPRTYRGESVDPDISKQARSRALIALGLSLARSASTGDYGSAFAEGAASFTGTMDNYLDQYRAQQKAEEQENYTRGRQDKQDTDEAAYQQARMADITTDNERQAADSKLKADQLDTKRKYHEQLMNDLPDDKRKLLEPFVGGEQFDTAWLQVMKPEDKSSHASEVRLNLALEAAARAQENSNYNRQRDEKQDVQRAQGQWDAAFSAEQKKVADALRNGRNAGVGKIDMNNPAAGPKPAPSSDELLAIERQAEQLARQAVEARLGPRPAGAPANIQRPSIPTASSNATLTYDPATGTFK